ncbi:hypothetical protein ATY41_03575 [Leifsonia xyli subsp. xyli]|uniref:Uncharacterized protein n=2 Tax=Leifsonia xyli subsp. xyli TaxID=59736 RepID=Q6AH29_LEIXX|nr:hypothetical protein [Leifsonia xyli]AAT88316.1 conserved hypothetical protein [Leifsonia xyli subsp. xyli str. CTCB07]ODA89757.1 hypothetical protein ATY41_03575 [Leifsonia xyli subsp. xyli]
MGFLDRLLGREEPRRDAPQSAEGWNADSQSTHGSNAYARNAPQPPARSDDEIAVERYRYLLRTAPPETIEQVHEEAFARLTADQRRLLFQQLSEGAPAGERPRGDDPRSLAQAATRSELRQPGTLERSLGGSGGGVGAASGMGFGGMLATSLLGSVAGYVIGSALVSTFLPTPGADQAADGTAEDGSGGDGSGGDGTATDTGSGDAGVETASADAGWGGDSGDWGGGGGGGWDGGGFGGDFL